jgi:hypothetical protein
MEKNAVRQRGLFKLFGIFICISMTLLTVWSVVSYPLFSRGKSNPPLQSTNNDDPKTLMFPLGKDLFKVIILSDLHFGEEPYSPWGPIQDFRSVRAMEKILDVESPDLVVLLGDLVTGEFMK